MQTINAAGLSLIESFEGFFAKWYPDPAHGWKVPTVGYGHTDMSGPPYFRDTKGKTFTKAEARAMLRRDLAKYEAAVRASVTVPLTDNQFSALVSFTYNLGPGNLRKSTLLRKLNAGNYAGAAGEFRRWNKAGGKVYRGLTRRRKAERDLFLTPDSPRPLIAPGSSFWARLRAMLRGPGA